MILEDRKLIGFVFLLILGGITYFVVHFGIKQIIGFPIASYWGLIFFGAMSVFAFLLRDVFDRSYDIHNFLNYRYYLTLQPLMGFFIVFPFIFYLLYSVSDFAVFPAKKSISIFTGMVESVDRSPYNNMQYDMVKFNVDNVYKGSESSTMSAKSGLIVPSGCGLNFQPGEAYLVYIMSYLGFDYIGCVGTKKIVSTDITAEEALNP